MPEQLTKHPEVTLQVLRSAGAKCGEGAPQTILTQCPADRFCALPGGELCVYGLDQAPRMTQISVSDWASVRQSLGIDDAGGGYLSSASMIMGGAGIVLGLVVGMMAMRAARRR